MNVDAMLDRLVEEAKCHIVFYSIRNIDTKEITTTVRQSLVNDISDKVFGAMQEAIMGAYSILRSNAEKYINGLYISESLTIEIKQEVEFLEYGYSSYDMKERLLTGKSSKISKSGDLYATVPIGKSDTSKTKVASKNKLEDLLKTSKITTEKKRDMSEELHEMLGGIHGGVSSKKPENFATVSSKNKDGDSWIHPGFQGVNQLEYINRNLKVSILEAIKYTILNEIERKGI